MDAWLREVGISQKGEEMLREYIGEQGGLEDVRDLEEEDKLELGTSPLLDCLLAWLQVGMCVASVDPTVNCPDDQDLDFQCGSLIADQHL